MTTSYTKSTLKLLQITDSHLFDSATGKLLGVNTRTSLLGVLRHIKKTQTDIDLIIATGDISHDGSNNSYEFFFNQIDQLAPIVRSLPGNHDHTNRLNNDWQHYTQAITDICNWRIVALDSTIPESNLGNLTESQFKLLNQACATAQNRHVLIAVHHNPVPMQSQWLDTMMIDNGADLMALIANHTNVKAIIWGHVHQEYDTTINFTQHHKVRLLACPATSIQFKPLSQSFSLDTAEPGYRLIELHDDGTFNTQVIRVDGLDIKPELESSGY